MPTQSTGVRLPRDGKTHARLASLAREQTEKALNVVIGIMMQKLNPPAVRLRAAEIIFNRGWGYPRQTHTVEGSEGQTLMKIVQEIIHVHETKETLDAETDDLVVDYSEIKVARNGNGHDDRQ